MAIFDEFPLKWRGQERRIPAGRIMRAIAGVEEEITLLEFSKYSERGTAPTAKLAIAYAGMLRQCGLDVSPDEVYRAMGEDGEFLMAVTQSIVRILQLMVPPSAQESVEREGGGEKKDEGATDAGRSSRSSTRRR